jgi:hypothetical protein
VGALNPYQPPQCTEPTALTGEALVMQVRYGLQYSLLFFFSGFALVSSAILMTVIAKPAVAVTNPLAALLSIVGVIHVALAMLCRKRVYFEVFEDRIEFLSPVFPRWRRPRPLATMGTFTLNLHRLVARRDDIKRFIAWREGSLR